MEAVNLQHSIGTRVSDPPFLLLYLHFLTLLFAFSSLRTLRFLSFLLQREGWEQLAYFLSASCGGTQFLRSFSFHSSTDTPTGGKRSVTSLLLNTVLLSSESPLEIKLQLHSESNRR